MKQFKYPPVLAPVYTYKKTLFLLVKLKMFKHKQTNKNLTLPPAKFQRNAAINSNFFLENISLSNE